MDQPPLANAPRKPLQFGLGTLLIGVLATAVVMGWHAHRLKQERLRRAAVAALGPDRLAFADPGNEKSDVVAAYLADGEITDAKMAHVRQFEKLQHLGLSGNPITDEGLANLKGLINLEYLNLRDTEISDDGLASIANLSRLEVLSLRGTNVTDSSVRHLVSLSRLQSLDLTGTRFTPQGLQSLQRALPSAKLYGTKSTPVMRGNSRARP